MTWSASLSRPVEPADHAALRTLADARAYMLTLPDDIAERQAWQCAAQLLMAAADDPTVPAIAAATRQLELALFTTNRSELSSKTKKGPATGRSR